MHTRTGDGYQDGLSRTLDPRCPCAQAPYSETFSKFQIRVSLQSSAICLAYWLMLAVAYLAQQARQTIVAETMRMA